MPLPEARLDRLFGWSIPRVARPRTAIELQIISILKEAGAVSHDQLVQRVARDLYEGELRRGAAVVDIGMFGSRLFEPEVALSLRAGDGTIWEIV